MAETKRMEDPKDMSIFETLNPINVNERVEVKNKFKYLSWAWAWAEVKKIYPEANFKIIKNDMGWIYHTDGKTAWVEVEVTINGLTHSEILPVMDYKNDSIPLEKITSFDVNKAVHRCLVKCLALHGLGLYIYAGEDLPEEIPDHKTDDQKQEDQTQTGKKKPSSKKKQEEYPRQPVQDLPEDFCTICRLPIMDFSGKNKNGDPVVYTKQMIIDTSTARFKAPICMSCMMKKANKDKKEVKA